ncbi:MAG: antitoxin [Actinomycetaceae bacterium]|nr:antitoxin [Actinomycetaceae bacterium]
MKDDLTNKAKDLVSDEEATDTILDKVEDAASKVTGGKFDDKIHTARDAVDERIGDE